MVSQAEFYDNQNNVQYDSMSQLTITNTLIEKNTASGDYFSRGGGIYTKKESHLIVTGVRIQKNTASYAGGGIYCEHNSSNNYYPCRLYSSLVVNNNAVYGGGIYLYSGDMNIVGVTISYNNAGGINGQEIMCNPSYADWLIFRSSIVYGSFGNNAVLLGQSTHVAYMFSLIQSKTTTSGDNLSGNINPGFVNIYNEDYRLQFNSPCRDKGHGYTYAPTDLTGNPRVYGPAADMGCYEYRLNPDASGIMYVKQEGSSLADGSSWSNAIPELAEALYCAKYDTRIQQIWVAQGTYAPMYAADGVSTNPRDKAFVLPSGVGVTVIVYGGFPAWGNPGIANRDADLYPVVLTGNVDNCYHVVVASGNTGYSLLDGLIITGGNANGTGSITVNGNSIFRNNGGGLYIASSSLYMSDMQITNNYADYAGGGIYTFSSSGNIHFSLISQNKATYGGGLYTENFSGNWRYVSIINNEATYGGGGMYNSNSSPVFANLRVCGNLSHQQGSAIYNHLSSPIIHNGLIAQNKCLGGSDSEADNIANLGNGSIYNKESSPELYNVTIAMSMPNGVGILNDNSYPNLCNTIVWSDWSIPASTVGVIDNNGSSTNYNSCMIQNLPQTANNLPSTNPKFIHAVNHNDYSANPGNYQLAPGSPCIDNGDIGCFGTMYSFDLNMKQRTVNNIDLGCYEYNIIPSAAGIVYVKKGGSGNKYGSSWANAAEELADALFWAQFPQSQIQEIWVAKGTYIPLYAADNLSLNPKDRSFVLAKDVQVFGGFPDVGNPGMNNRNATAYPTILTGEDLHLPADEHFYYGQPYHVVISSGDVGSATLDGFTITEGNADGIGFIMVNGNQIYRNNGGGVYVNNVNNVNNTSPWLNDLIIINNHADNMGGGLYNNAPMLAVHFMLVSNNTAAYGGGVYNNGFQGEWRYISITDNQALYSGGGMYNLNTNAMFTSLRVCGNESQQDGSAIYNDQSSPLFYTGLIAQNEAMNGGGAIFNSSSSPAFYNVTITMSMPNGLGMENSISYPVLCNSIIWSGQGGPGVKDIGSSVSSYNLCLIENIAQTANNLPPGTNPNFINPVWSSDYANNFGDYHLSAGSPCIDQGDIACLYLHTIDLDLNNRPINNLDLGCYEFDPVNPNPPNSPYHKHNGNEIIADQPQETLATSDIKLNVYPNPSSSGEQVQIRLGNENVYYENAVTVNLYSLEGKLLKTKDCSNGAFSLEMPPLAAGIYLLTIRTTEGKTYNKKIVIK
jgi:hypothetical protein